MTEVEDRLVKEMEQIAEVGADVRHEVATRIAEWLTAAEPEPTCTIRSRGSLITVRRADAMLELMVLRASFQLDDWVGESLFPHRGGPSVIQHGTPVPRLVIPLSETLKGNR